MVYMAEQGWGDDIAMLTIAQILQIRDQPGWKTPLEESATRAQMLKQEEDEDE